MWALSPRFTEISENLAKISAILTTDPNRLLLTHVIKRRSMPVQNLKRVYYNDQYLEPLLSRILS